MHKKKGVILIAMLLLIIASYSAYSESVQITNPAEKRYYYELDDESTKIYIDYIIESSVDGEVYLTVDDAKVPVIKENLINKFTKSTPITIRNSEQSFRFDKEIHNRFIYSADLNIAENGNIHIYLKDNEIILYPNKDGTFGITCNNQKTGLNGIGLGTDSTLTIQGNTDGQYYQTLTIRAGDKEYECAAIKGSHSFEMISYKSVAAKTTISNQRLDAGTYFANIPKGKHTVAIETTGPEGTIRDTKSFEIIPNRCGDGICTDIETQDTCAQDCSTIICTGNSYIGDTDNDGKIDSKDIDNLRQALADNDIPDIDCCIDTNKDNKIDQRDIERMQKIIDEKLSYERCNLDCFTTKDNECSDDKPYYCYAGNLEERCEICGCPDGSVCLDDNRCFPIKSCKCSDIAAQENNPNDYDNYIDIHDEERIISFMDVCKSDSRYNPKYDLNSDGCIDEKDTACISSRLGTFTTCAGEARCRDGTQPGQCSENKPYYCKETELVDSCKECGCPLYMICSNDGSCIFNNILYSHINTDLDINDNVRYQNKTITLRPDNNTVEFMIELKGTQDIKGVELELELENTESDEPDAVIDEASFFVFGERASILDIDEKRKLVTVRLDDIDRHPWGMYEGSLDILISSNVYDSIPMNLKVKDYESTEMILKITDQYTTKIPYVTLYKGAGIALILSVAIIILMIKRHRDKRYMNQLKLESRTLFK